MSVPPARDNPQLFTPYRPPRALGPSSSGSTFPNARDRPPQHQQQRSAPHQRDSAYHSCGSCAQPRQSFGSRRDDFVPPSRDSGWGRRTPSNVEQLSQSQAGPSLAASNSRPASPPLRRRSPPPALAAASAVVDEWDDWGVPPPSRVEPPAREPAPAVILPITPLTSNSTVARDEWDEWDDAPGVESPASTPCATALVQPSPSPPTYPSQLIDASSETLRKAALKSHRSPTIFELLNKEQVEPVLDEEAERAREEQRVKLANLRERELEVVEQRKRDRAQREEEKSRRVEGQGGSMRNKTAADGIFYKIHRQANVVKQHTKSSGPPRSIPSPAPVERRASPPPRRRSAEIARDKLSPHLRRDASGSKEKKTKEMWNDDEESEVTSPDEAEESDELDDSVWKQKKIHQLRPSERLKFKGARASLSPEQLKSRLAERDPVENAFARPRTKSPRAKPQTSLPPPTLPPSPQLEVPPMPSQSQAPPRDLFAAIQSNKDRIAKEANKAKKKRKDDERAGRDANALVLSSGSDRSSDLSSDDEPLAEGSGRRVRHDSVLDVSDNEPAIDPDELCPFCSERLPEHPSARLKNLLAYLLEHSSIKSKPTKKNSRAKHLPLAVHANLCDLHRNETTVIPHGIAQGWPTTIDFEKLPRRLDRELSLLMTQIIVGRQGTKFFQRAKEEWETKGPLKMRNPLSELDSIEDELPGYFGPHGRDVIINSLKKNFVATQILIEARTAPLPVDAYLRRVLVPECAVELIRRDLVLKQGGDIENLSPESREEAERILEESRDFGRALHSTSEEDDLFSREEELREQEEEERKAAGESAKKKKKKKKAKSTREAGDPVLLDLTSPPPSSHSLRKPKRAAAVDQSKATPSPSGPLKVKLRLPPISAHLSSAAPASPKGRTTPKRKATREVTAPRPKARRIATPARTDAIELD